VLNPPQVDDYGLRDFDTVAPTAISRHAARRATSRRSFYRDALNWLSASLHGADSAAALLAKHRRMRPPPGAIPPHSVRASAAQAERSTKICSRGRIGRSVIGGAAAAAGGAAGAAVVATAAGAGADFLAAAGAFGAAGAAAAGAGEVDGAAAAAAGVAGVAGGFAGSAAGGCSDFGAGAGVSVFAAAAGGACMALTAVLQDADRLAMFLCRHCSDSAPPGGTLEQCAM
jgi:hypothetical protein